MTSFYITERFGPQQAATHEGFLVVHDVPLARTGTQLYSDREVPVRGNREGRVLITRDEGEVFRPQTIASLQGKPITIDHPDEDVTPANWRDLAVGHVVNPRRGEGRLGHLLLGDLFVTCPRAIEAIRDGSLREVSVGYEADYEDHGDGQGAQKNIVANHLALVDSGRCGPTCRIGDSATVPQDCGRDACTCSTRDADVPSSSSEQADEGSAPTLAIELLAMDPGSLRRLVDFWRYVRRAAASGHSFAIEADRDEHMPEFWPHDGHPTCHVDGDGADRLGRILLDGEDVTDPPEENEEESEASDTEDSPVATRDAVAARRRPKIYIHV